LPSTFRVRDQVHERCYEVGEKIIAVERQRFRVLLVEAAERKERQRAWRRLP
jgi:hypothetical protein